MKIKKLAEERVGKANIKYASKVKKPKKPKVIGTKSDKKKNKKKQLFKGGPTDRNYPRPGG